VLTPRALGPARCLLVLALDGTDPRGPAGSREPADPGMTPVLAALARGRVRTALYATVPPSHPT
jgi:hypothetical protein